MNIDPIGGRWRVFRYGIPGNVPGCNVGIQNNPGKDVFYPDQYVRGYTPCLEDQEFFSMPWSAASIGETCSYIQYPR